MAAVPGGGLVSIPPMSPMTMAAAAAAAAAITPQQLQPQISTLMQAGTPMSTMFTGSVTMPSIISTMAAATAQPPSFSIVTSGGTTNSLASVSATELSNNLLNGTNDGHCSNVSMSPSRSQSSDSPPILSAGCNSSVMGGRGTPTSGIGSGMSCSAEEEKNNAEFLKELIAEKDSLEVTSDETILKSNTIKLLEQGRINYVRKCWPIYSFLHNSGRHDLSFNTDNYSISRMYLLIHMFWT